MKKLVFFTVLMTVFSCSKDLNNRITFDSDDLVAINNATPKPIPVLDTVSLSKFLIKKPLTAQEKDSISKIETLSASLINNSGNAIIASESPEYTDYSGYIHLKYFYATTTPKQQHPSLSVPVTSAYAMVGGGALVSGYTGNGAFLTQSRPYNSTTWIAESKDHIVADPHYLTVYAIGMRIDGVDPNYLRSKVHITQATSASNDWPSITAPVFENCFLIGGGAWDHWSGYGNLLTSSIPYEDEWAVSGKAYRRSSPATITAYAIGIENISYPTVGNLLVTVRYAEAAILYGVGYCSAPVWDGYALSCPGGAAYYNLAGRMLVGLYPQGSFPWAQVISKDTPGFADYGSTSAYAVGVEKRPY